ncbi:UbiA prenyltransferase family [Rhodocollybia butyracea]|uniref:UbiA prenyltransferase family n=1 Tax=Rhodocollybia butyracea TaxID=206335 RepID=A0A9P5TUW8_9AGAR|nr:UbiA prenyltransferase family [Rhodocollybia butyracea]
MYTAILFTWTDYKTIFFPIISFAYASVSVRSTAVFLKACLWIWIHLLLCNVSNQARTEVEDATNRPWRPLPSGRVTNLQAIALRWVLVFVCIAVSSVFGWHLVVSTLTLIFTTYMYDELEISSHGVGKNLCAVGGYLSFEVGAVKIMGESTTLNPASTRAIYVSLLLIFTTIHTQDFADMEGDLALGRKTLPMYDPEIPRIATMLIITTWSTVLPIVWGIGPISTAGFVAFGSYVSLRFYIWRTAEMDRRSYLIFNIWLVMAHLLPIQARAGCISW